MEMERGRAGRARELKRRRAAFFSSVPAFPFSPSKLWPSPMPYIRDSNILSLGKKKKEERKKNKNECSVRVIRGAAIKPSFVNSCRVFLCLWFAIRLDRGFPHRAITSRGAKKRMRYAGTCGWPWERKSGFRGNIEGARGMGGSVIKSTAGVFWDRRPPQSNSQGGYSLLRHNLFHIS